MSARPQVTATAPLGSGHNAPAAIARVPARHTAPKTAHATCAAHMFYEDDAILNISSLTWRYFNGAW